MTAARRSGYEVAILSSSKMSVRRAPHLNPATLLPLVDINDELLTHDCEVLSDTVTPPWPDLKLITIPNPDVIFFNIGLVTRSSDMQYPACYAATTQTGILGAYALPYGVVYTYSCLYFGSGKLRGLYNTRLTDSTRNSDI